MFANDLPKTALRLGFISVLAPWVFVLQRDWKTLVERSPGIAVDSDFFPTFLALPELFLTALLVGPIFMSVPVARPQKRIAQICALASLVAAGYLVLSPRTLGYQVFVTTFWVSVWNFWLATRIQDFDANVMRRGRILAGLILSLVFGTAAIGKMTPGYWDGQALYHLFFLYQSDIKFQMIRESVDREGLIAIAIAYSRVSVLAEASMAMIPWMLKPKWSFVFWILGLLGMWLVTNVNIIEAIGPLLGLAFAGLLLTEEIEDPEVEQSTVISNRTPDDEERETE